MWSAFTITSSDPPLLLAERLTGALEEEKPWFWGVASASEFEVTRAFWSTERGFPVTAFGRFDPTPDGGTRIRVRMLPSSWTLLALVIVTATALVTWFNHTVADDWFAPWFFSGMVVFFWCLAFIVTRVEIYRCRTQLERVLKASRDASA